MGGVPVILRIGCSAEVKRIMDVGLASSNTQDVACCTDILLAIIFQVRAVSLSHLPRQHVDIDSKSLTISCYRSNRKSVRRHLILRYSCCPAWGPENPFTLVQKWSSTVL